MRTSTVALLAWCVTAAALDAAALNAAVAQELEPGVRTSSAAAPVSGEPGKSSTGNAGRPSSSVPVAAAAPSEGASKPETAAAKSPKSDKSAERVELDTTQISGNRELPKVMYVVPWRKPELGEFAGRPPNSLLDEALTPIDRDVFRRQNRYYSALKEQAGPAKSQPGAAADGSATPAPKDEK